MVQRIEIYKSVDNYTAESTIYTKTTQKSLHNSQSVKKRAEKKEFDLSVTIEDRYKAEFRVKN